MVQATEHKNSNLLAQSQILQGQLGVVPEEVAEEQEDDSEDGHRRSTWLNSGTVRAERAV